MKRINGEIWPDAEGNEIHAHGGCRLAFGKALYWYGEDRRGDAYVSCYQSLDGGKTWRFVRHILTADSPVKKIHEGRDLSLRNSDGNRVNIERPKVIYNRNTGKFILWAHYEDGINYHAARCAVASCDTPDGDFVYHGSFRPVGYMSRDCTLFVDGDRIYFLSASEHNRDLHLYRLTKDGLDVEVFVQKLFAGQSREAPAVIQKDGKYLLVTSFCTGWKPNQCAYAVADRMEGEWSENLPLGDATTYLSQPAFLYEREDGEIVYFGDRWGGNAFAESAFDRSQFDYQKSAYVGYRLVFRDGKAELIHSHEAFL
ncbi:MAG: family 43 glycosylhydrolase [Clostridia bacterium]|nr:family 43 glycosylhydrolase [Clostridia bacterium]